MGSDNTKPTVSRKDRMKLTEPDASAPAPASIQDATDVLRKAEADRMALCRKEVDIVLAKYGCTLASNILICGSDVTSRVLVIPKKGG